MSFVPLERVVETCREVHDRVAIRPARRGNGQCFDQKPRARHRKPRLGSFVQKALCVNRLGFVFALLFMFASASPGQGARGRSILKNGDFERFSGDTPAGWESTNIPNMLTVVSRSATSQGGKSSVKCEVKDFYGTKMGGMLWLKDLSAQGSSLTVKGFYLLHSIGKDVGFLSVSFKNAQGSSVGSIEEFLPKSSNEFIPFAKTGPIPDGTTRLDVQLTLLAGVDSGNLHEGSYVLFDTMELHVPGDQAEPTGP